MIQIDLKSPFPTRRLFQAYFPACYPCNIIQHNILIWFTLPQSQSLEVLIRGVTIHRYYRDWHCHQQLSMHRYKIIIMKFSLWVLAKLRWKDVNINMKGRWFDNSSVYVEFDGAFCKLYFINSFHFPFLFIHILLFKF